MKVYVVCIDYDYEGYGLPEFVGSSHERAEKYVKDKLTKKAISEKVNVEKYIEKYVKDFEITEVEME